MLYLLFDLDKPKLDSTLLRIDFVPNRIYKGKKTYFVEIVTKRIGKDAMLFQLRMYMYSTKMRDAKLSAFKAMIAIAAPSK